MSNEVRQTTPPDEEISEYWERLPDDEIYFRGVEVAAGEQIDGWQVTLFAGEYFRDDPLGLELQQRLESALRAIPGVTKADRIRPETWEVNGTASGEAVCRVAASVVDELADRMRVAYETDSY